MSLNSQHSTMPPRRYPRLSANDRAGRPVSIPLSIAPRLLPHEEFVAPPQKKVYEIFEANERLAKVNARHKGEGSDESTETKELPMKKREDSGSTTHAPSLAREMDVSTAPSSPGVIDSSTETSIPEAGPRKRPRRWTREEDEIVLSAVMMKQPGRSVIEKLPHRSKSAVLQRFYKIKERHEKALKEAEESDCESLIDLEDDGMDTQTETDPCEDDKLEFCEDEDMDEIPPY